MTLTTEPRGEVTADPDIDQKDVVRRYLDLPKYIQLLSHWPVASKASVLLTTIMLKEYEANPAQGRSEAHRKAMMATPEYPEYAQLTRFSGRRSSLLAKVVWATLSDEA